MSQTSGDLHGLNTNEEILDKDSTQVTEELVSALENIIDGNVKDEDSDTAQEKVGCDEQHTCRVSDGANYEMFKNLA